MSETGFATIVTRSDSKNLPNSLTVGKVCPGFEVKIIDKKGDALPANKEGEICMRSLQVCNYD